MDRWIELCIVYVLAPLIVYLGWFPSRGKMLLLAAVAVVQVLVAEWHGASLGQLGIVRGDTGRCLLVGCGLWAVSQLVAIVICARLGRPCFPFAANCPRLFGLITTVYCASVAAQEFMFRSYFFWRYGNLASPVALFIINVLVFGWIHIVFKSWLSVGLTLIGGVVFTALFQTYHSLLGVSVVHWLCGMSIFAMGYGRSFYGGSEEIARQLECRAVPAHG